MLDLENALFDEETDGIVPVPPGNYPAHITDVKIRTFDSGSTVYNLTFKVAPEVSNQTVPKLSMNGDGTPTASTDKDGNALTINGAFLSGKEFRLDNGMWLTPNPAKGEGWKNRRYTEWCESLGLEFKKNKDGKKKLGQAEEDDLLGRGCTIQLKEVAWENKDTGQSGKAMKAVSLSNWDKSYNLSSDELAVDDLPF